MQLNVDSESGCWVMLHNFIRVFLKVKKEIEQKRIFVGLRRLKLKSKRLLTKCNSESWEGFVS